ncbi:helix-turn-helix domain-containing protein [Galbibacter marinus]|uniref:Helix-turn-helix domain-containing protein n=1 Tax=Galbibacter marinus TaxID=555500 RepID=K2QMB6_9FLAO|nr:helix-turn-helix transcriptional regulator [Galbibacter marinus]EKF56002.1 helix-turn-helix domain-containing protein [Galbibacter marinus]
MVNKDEFIKRLEKVLEYYGLSASAFADSIGVQRSSISHLLSGRNNPSLDFVLKILHQYPDVELYWLLNGKGNFPIKSAPNPNSKMVLDLGEEDQSTYSEKTPYEVPNTAVSGQKKPISRIVIFYKDGTFEEFKNDRE